MDSPEIEKSTARFVDIICVEGLDRPVILELRIEEDSNRTTNFIPLGVCLLDAKLNGPVNGCNSGSSKWLVVSAYGSRQWQLIVAYINQEGASEKYDRICILADSPEEYQTYRACVTTKAKFIRFPAGTSAYVGDVIWSIFNFMGVGRLGFD